MPNHELTDQLAIPKSKKIQRDVRSQKTLSQDSCSDRLSLQSVDSFNSHHTVDSVQEQGIVELKNYKEMLLERKNRYQHKVITVVQDKADKKYQSFCRGEAITILNSCTDYWNGEEVVTISEKLKTEIKQLVAQWETENFDSIGFSYKPVTADFADEIQRQKKAKDIFDKDLASKFIKNQIFLGCIAIKHHKKLEAKEQINELDRAGIRAVIFSKEAVLETKCFGYELGIDNDWNSWISLRDDPSKLTQRINQDEKVILPCGIEKVKDHLKNTDQIPLQVPLFCDVTEQTTRQMF